MKKRQVILMQSVQQPILKRRIALLRSMNKYDEAVSALVDYLEAFSTDAEAWCELADLYQSNGMSAQAIFSLEEALLITPNSWNVRPSPLQIRDMDNCLTSRIATCTTRRSSLHLYNVRRPRHFHHANVIKIGQTFLTKPWAMWRLCERIVWPHHGTTPYSPSALTWAYTNRCWVQTTTELIKHIQNRTEQNTDFELPSVKTLEELKAMAIQKAEKLIQSQQSATHQPDGLVSLTELVQQK